MAKDRTTLEPRMIEAVGQRIYGTDWQAETAKLLGVDGSAVRKWTLETASRTEISAAAGTALVLRLVLRLVLAEAREGAVEIGAVEDMDAFVAATKRALRIEQRKPLLASKPTAAVARAIERAVAATTLTGEQIEALLRAAEDGPVPEHKLRSRVIECSSVHEAAEAIIDAWNDALNSDGRDGGFLTQNGKDQVGSFDMAPLSEIVDQLAWYAPAFDALHQTDDADDWEWAHDQLTDAVDPERVRRELKAREEARDAAQAEEVE